MLSKFGKIFYVATAILPIFAVMSINSGIHKKWDFAAIWLGVFIGLAVLFRLFMYWVHKDVTAFPIKTQKVKSADIEVLAFLFTYLLPFFSKESAEFAGDLATAISVVVVIIIVVWRSSACTFNPVLSICGYRFYEVEHGGMTYVVATKRDLKQAENDLRIKHLHDLMYIDEGEPRNPNKSGIRRFLPFYRNKKRSETQPARDDTSTSASLE